MAPRTNPDAILEVEDPVAALASQGYEVLMDHPDFLGACNKLVFRSMGLHPQTRVGGDEQDEIDFYHEWLDDWMRAGNSVVALSYAPPGTIPDFISEEHPRYNEYWQMLAGLLNQICAQMISVQKYQWTKEFAEREAERQS